MVFLLLVQIIKFGILADQQSLFCILIHQVQAVSLVQSVSHPSDQGRACWAIGVVRERSEQSQVASLHGSPMAGTHTGHD